MSYGAHGGFILTTPPTDWQATCEENGGTFSAVPFWLGRRRVRLHARHQPPGLCPPERHLCGLSRRRGCWNRRANHILPTEWERVTGAASVPDRSNRPNRTTGGGPPRGEQGACPRLLPRPMASRASSRVEKVWRSATMLSRIVQELNDSHHHRLRGSPRDRVLPGDTRTRSSKGSTSSSSMRVLSNCSKVLVIGDHGVPTPIDPASGEVEYVWNSTSGWSSATGAKARPVVDPPIWLNASYSRRTTSTFACDIARPVSQSSDQVDRPASPPSPANAMLRTPAAFPASFGPRQVGETGFEPATARPPAGCATRLRHSP